MALEPGTRLGHYEVLSSLGAGGMGEVYRAKDTKLGREVAIKLLLDEVSADPERVARFEREAKVLASLNHNNIATLYGFESEGDKQFLVMELVEGETLADRVARGSIPVDEAVPLFLQIAEGLEAAHEKGVIHRDLKPANIKVTDDGQVKILDFGLAKAMAAEADATAAASLSMSPTLTLAATRRGEILGTAAYMSPEQARGKSIDKRTDIWAFGCCMFEALSGERPFGGAEFPEILASVLKDEPDLRRLPGDTPPVVRRLIRRCLAKDALDRLRDIGDVRLELRTDDDPEAIELAGSLRRRSRWGVLALVGAGILVGALIVLVSSRVSSGEDPFDPATAMGATALKTQIRLPDSAPLPLGTSTGVDEVYFALSPDGRQLVFVGTTESGTRLFRRDLSSFAPPREIPGTENASHPFFSPDGKSIGFLGDDRRLKRVSLDGDDRRVLATYGSAQRAGWTEDGWIYFGDNEGGTLRRVRESGGDTETLATFQANFSDVDPEGKMVLLSRLGLQLSANYATVDLLDLETMKVQPLVAGGYDARFVGRDHVVFARSGSLLVSRFDPEERRLVGEPATLVRGVATDSSFGWVQLAVSRVGSLAFVPGNDRPVARLGWIDREGNEGTLPIEPRHFGTLDLSDDDRYLAVHVGDVTDHILIYDLERQEETRLPGTENAGWPQWNHAGDSISFVSRDASGVSLMVQTVDGAESPREIYSEKGGQLDNSSWAPDDSGLVISDWYRGIVGIASLAEPGSVSWIGRDEGFFVWPFFSPDGRWFGHTNGDSTSLYLRSYPDDETRRQFTQVQGGEFVWCSKCDEIFYASYFDDAGWMSVPVTHEPELSVGTPQVAFSTDYVDTPGRSYDVSSDGQRLYIVKQLAPEERNTINLITNLYAELDGLLTADPQ